MKFKAYKALFVNINAVLLLIWLAIWGLFGLISRTLSARLTYLLSLVKWRNTEVMNFVCFPISLLDSIIGFLLNHTSWLSFSLHWFDCHSQLRRSCECSLALVGNLSWFNLSARLTNLISSPLWTLGTFICKIPQCVMFAHQKCFQDSWWFLLCLTFSIAFLLRLLACWGSGNPNIPEYHWG